MTQKLDFNPEFKKAIQFMQKGEQTLFITGKAGTGKSTLLDYFCSKASTKPVVLAPTGVAALNVNGLTIHNFFNFYIDITVEKIKKQKHPPKNPHVYKKLKTIIIDEISMVRADLMDCVDVFLRRHGPQKNKAFGGVQMIFVGDLYQLPPVVTSAEQKIFSSHYKSPFFFSSKAFENLKLKIIELKKVYRQKDQKFIDLLNRIRNNSITAKDMEVLNSRYLPSFKPKKQDFYIHLSARNKTADCINEQQLTNLPGKMHQSLAFIEGDFGREYYPTHPELKFKVGSQIMLLNNDQKRRWVNGTVGVIEAVYQDKQIISVNLYPNNKKVLVTPYRWEIYRFSMKKQTLISEEIGSFCQYPIRLAWAITIHKSQGKTFERVILDASQGMFASGQAYVALSRCQTFEGLILKQPMKKHYIRTDHRIFDFLTGVRYQKANKEMPLKEKTQIIKQAIKNKKTLDITYLKPNDIQSKRKVKPLELGLQSYKNKQFTGIRAFCLTRKEERTFRIDRILKLEVI